MIKLIIAFLLLTEVVRGGTIRPEVPDSEYIKYGEKYTSVVKISGVYSGESEKEVIASGSAVIIDEHWVLTAAHVLDSMKNPYFHVGNKKYIISKTIANPEFDIQKSMSPGDIALCYVEEKIDISFYPKLYDKDDEENKVCGLSGYGLHGNAINGSKENDNKKRGGSNKVFLVTDSLLFCDMSKKNPTSLEFLIAHGDSGGGLFIDGKLAGIHSFVSASDGKPDSSYGDESGHTRISKYKTWIESNINNFKY